MNAVLKSCDENLAQAIEKIDTTVQKALEKITDGKQEKSTANNSSADNRPASVPHPTSVPGPESLVHGVVNGEK